MYHAWLENRDTEKIEKILEADCQTICYYFDKWYLELNTIKGVANLFHLNNHEDNKTFNIKVNNLKLEYDITWAYHIYEVASWDAR